MAKHGNFKRISAKDTKHLQIKEPPPDYDKMRPLFSFRHMDHGSKTCLSSCQKNSKADIADTLLQLSQQTWSRILSTYRGGNGKESIPINEFKVPLPSFVTPDVKSLMVFHFSKAGRMAGIRHNDIYHILVIGDNLYDH